MELVRYELLEKIGVNLYIEKLQYRTFKIKNLKINSRYWVLLPENIEEIEGPEDNIEEIKKVFNGMLTVLECEPQDYSILWLNAWNEAKGETEEATFMVETLEEIQQAIKQWHPSALLILGKKLGETIKDKLIDKIQASNLKFGYTFHPNELVIEPKKKRQAYEDLLNFKKTMLEI